MILQFDTRRAQEGHQQVPNPATVSSSKILPYKKTALDWLLLPTFGAGWPSDVTLPLGVPAPGVQLWAWFGVAPCPPSSHPPDLCALCSPSFSASPFLVVQLLCLVASIPISSLLQLLFYGQAAAQVERATLLPATGPAFQGF